MRSRVCTKCGIRKAITNYASETSTVCLKCKPKPKRKKKSKKED